MPELEEEVRRLKSIVEELAREVEKLKERIEERSQKSVLAEEPEYVKTVLRVFEEQLRGKPDAGLVFVGGIERRGGKIRGSFLSAIPLEEVAMCPPRRIVGAMGVFSNENRVRILQALLKGARTSSELSRETGLEGGQLYHHLKELMLAGYVEAVERGKYALTAKGCIAIRVAAAMASIPGFAASGLEELGEGASKPEKRHARSTGGAR